MERFISPSLFLSISASALFSHCTFTLAAVTSKAFIADSIKLFKIPFSSLTSTDLVPFGTATLSLTIFFSDSLAASSASLISSEDTLASALFFDTDSAFTFATGLALSATVPSLAVSDFLLS